jgi:GH35 family endo-1,4-beta-xylanase
MKPSNRRSASILGTSVIATLLAAVAALAAAPGAGPAGAPAVDQNGPTILQTYKGHFLIGTAGDPPGGFSEQELKLIKDNFNCISPENYLKPAPVHPQEDVWSFKRPDAMVAFCAANNIAVHGHTLLWHSQTNNFFFQGGDKEVILKRMKDHITTLVGHYKGKIRSWDVLNEAINDGGGGRGGMPGGPGGGAAPAGYPDENLRGSQWFNNLGPDFVTIAFKTAHEADPDCKLFYNDYNIENGPKHTASMALLRRLIKEGAPIYGVGIQGHWSTNGLPYAALDQAIADYASLGLKVAISELDITIAGTSGGQLGPGAPGGPGGFGGPGGGGGRRGRGGATAPATGPAGVFLPNDESLIFTAAPGGFGGGAAFGGAGGRGGRGGPAAAQPPANPATTIPEVISDLSDAQKNQLKTIADDVGSKLSQWQKSSTTALLMVQPQYTRGQVAYDHEIEEYSAEQVKQNGLRDEILNDADVSLDAILTPAQAQKWQASRLSAQFNTQFGALNVTDAQKAKVDAIAADSAKTLAAAKDKAAVAAAKADFTKKAMAVLDEAQLQQYQASTNRGGGGGAAAGGRGRGGGGPATEAGLKAQADAFARIFTIFEKHKDAMDHVTIWGLNDARSWRPGQHATIFDENNLRKPCYNAIVDAFTHPVAYPIPTTAPASMP